jgi:hypothetical protein
MRLDVIADPARPNGGYARLTTRADLVPDDQVLVSVFDAFSERFLGKDNWQAERVEFGPYPVERSGDEAGLVIGPEIVNQIEEYAVLRISIGAVTGDVNWPDDVVPLPGAAQLGGLHVPRGDAPEPVDPAPARAPGPALSGQRPEPVAADPEPVPAPDPGDVRPPEPPRKSNGALFAGLLVLALLVAGVGYYYFYRTSDIEPGQKVATQQAPPEPDDPCSNQAISTAEQGAFADLRALLETCADRIAPDRALSMIENGAASDDPGALELLGQLYDAAVNDDPIEQGIGLRLTDSPPKAAEYYARARLAGSRVAGARLEALCQTLRVAEDTLSKYASEEYCAP